MEAANFSNHCNTLSAGASNQERATMRGCLRLLILVSALCCMPLAVSASSVTRLVLLGTQGGPVSRGNRAQPANLLIVRGTPYLIDAGNGVARQLALAKVPIASIHQIFITHNHDDHAADWGTLMGLAWSIGNRSPMTVYGPAGTESMLKAFEQFFETNEVARYVPGGNNAPLSSVASAHDIAGPGVIYEDGNIRVTAVENCHYHYGPGVPGYASPKSYAFRFQTPDRVIVFSGDTGPCGDTISRFAKGADILVHEVENLGAFEQLLPRNANPRWRNDLMQHMRTEHSTPEEVGRVAHDAGVGMVVLTHVIPGLPSDPDSIYIAGVRKLYSGKVVLGADLMEF